ncbi:UDP-N-acetylmuramate dehydrogenase [Shewanella gaetbuli]
MTDSLKPFNTLGLNQSCEQVISLSDKQALVNTCYELYHSDTAMVILGGGSNIVFTEDFAGKVVHISTKGIDVEHTDDEVLLKVEAGENWHELVKYCLEHNYYGIENLALIPGTVGAAPIQNIGAYGVEFASVCHSVEFVDLDAGEMYEISSADCLFGYRDSIFKQQLHGKALITAVTLKLSTQWRPQLTYAPLSHLKPDEITARDVFDLVCKVRSEKLPDPVEVGNVGSFFKNPIISTEQLATLQQTYPNIVFFPLNSEQVKLAAAWLIDQAGLKGHIVGGAAVHNKQALVIVNKGDATGHDICQLALSIIDKVEDDFNITLQPEPRIMAEFGEVVL